MPLATLPRLLTVLCLAAAAVHAASSTPPPVPGYPIGVCIRAKAESLADARAAGFEQVELALQDVLGMTAPEFAAFSGQLAASGIRAFSGYNPVPKELPLVGPTINLAAQNAHLELLLERAAALKLSCIIFNSGPAWRVPEGFPAEQAATQLVDFARRLATAAQARGILVLIAPLRSTDSNQLTTLAEVIPFVNAVNHPNFGMMADFSFLTVQKETMASLRPAGRHLRHVHLANPAVTPRTFPMNDTDCDYAAFFAVLREINYRGGLSVHATTKDFAADAPRAIAFLRAKALELSAAAR
jgi:D-psicose/D-tagatose/L-ribulose 3-epimerase